MGDDRVRAKRPVAAAPQPRLHRSTLEVFVNGVKWEERGSFYGCGPEDPVYTVRHDDAQVTTIMFGDGTRGARVGGG